MAFSLEDISKFFTDNPDLIGGAAGALSGFFGGDDQVSKPWMVPGAQEGLTEAVSAARDQFDQGPRQYYPGQTVADLNPNVQQGWNDQLASQDRMQQLADRSAMGTGKLLTGGDKVGGFQLQDQIGFGIPEEYQSAIMNPIMRNLNEQVIPGIHTAAQSQGAFGGSRMQQQKSDAASQATEMATDAMIRGNLQARGQSIGQRAGDISAQLSGRSQDIQQNQYGMDNIRAGVNAATTAMGQQLAPGQMQAGIGAQQQGYDQSLIDADMARFDWNNQEGMNYIDRLIQRVGGKYMPTGEIQQGDSGGWLDALLGGLNGANIFNAAYSKPVDANTSPAPATTP